jgi:hypothetical protein
VLLGYVSLLMLIVHTLRNIGSGPAKAKWVLIAMLFRALISYRCSFYFPKGKNAFKLLLLHIKMVFSCWYYSKSREWHYVGTRISLY